LAGFTAVAFGLALNPSIFGHLPRVVPSQVSPQAHYRVGVVEQQQQQQQQKHFEDNLVAVLYTDLRV
jgi:hypothetical protein